MPVTAKLSLKFYEKLGEEVATELVEWFNSVDATYRGDLRELNELNFARFDAKVEQRLGALEARMDRRHAALELKVEQQLTEMRKEIGSLRQETRDSIAALRAELIKWSFVFFATAALAVIGLR
jgi:hypothetical protein